MKSPSQSKSVEKDYTLTKLIPQKLRAIQSHYFSPDAVVVCVKSFVKFWGRLFETNVKKKLVTSYLNFFNLRNINAPFK